MAETITLRAYLSELESLLERDSLAEVISHCRYILQHYPQNVDTYRLLAKVLLQRAHDENGSDLFNESAEVFQRVLSVLPNDYVAHLGMSEIREHDGALDEAIWHLERAYEQIPGNQMLQQALRELYIKRDGEGHASEKIQLTRAALARQYINGQLYDQALIELRTALQQNPDRVDLQVLLAETLWESQHPIEAAEVAVQILRKLPNCLPANRILARLWLDNERPTDAQVFLDRLEAVDPYTAASVVRPDSEISEQVTLSRLDYQTQAQATSASETPEWVQELGDMGGEFDLTGAFQTPSGEQPPERLDTDAMFGEPAGNFEGWTSEPASAAVAEDVPDWFADLEGRLDVAKPPAAPATQPAEPGGMDWFNEPPVFEAESKLADEPALAADVPDWFANVLEEQAPPPPAAQSAVEADWLSGDEEQPPMQSLEALLGAAPANQAAVEAEWLLDEELGESPQPSIESLLEAAPTAQEAAPPEWLFTDQEATAEPTSPVSDQVQDAETIPFKDTREDQPSSGFTDLLEEIQTARTSETLFDEMSEIEPEPPAWLSEFEEVQTPGEAPEAEPGTPAQAPYIEDLVEASAELPSGESFDALEQDQVAWSDLGSESQPAAEQPLSAAAGRAEEDVAFLASFDEPLPDLESFSVHETAEPVAAPAEDWLSDLRDVTEMWEDVPELAEMPEVPGEQMPAAAVSASEITEMIEPASELPDWVRDAAPKSEAGSTVSPVVDQTTGVIPTPPVVDEDMMALFETQETVISPAEGWAPFETAAEVSGSEAQGEPETDWLQPAATEDDWLGSFAKPAAEPEIISEEPSLEPLSLDTLAQPADTPGATWWQEDAQSLEPVEDAGQTDEWLGTISDLELEGVSETPESYPANDLAIDLEPERVIEEVEPPVPAESSETSETGFTSRLLSSLADKQADSEETETPAWLADMEPVQTPVEEGLGDLFEQPYDPFEGGKSDNVPQYISARDTGILQPDERPDWMTAFTGEELPVESLEAPELEPTLEIEQETEPGELAVSGTGSLMDSLRDEEEPSDDYFLDTEETLVLDQNRSGEVEGTMPDWLVAITKSETDKFQDLLPEEPEPYLAEDTGVLQPGSDPDWLQQIDDKPETQEGWVDTDATDILSLDELMAGIEQPHPVDPDRTDIYQPGFNETEPLDQEIADLVLGTGESDTEPTQTFGDDFDAQGMLADMATFREDEVAQPIDLAHTSRMESAFDQTELYDDDLDEDLVPDDFSFGDLLPLVLRGTSNGSLRADESPRSGDGPQLPDWLTDAFKD